MGQERNSSRPIPSTTAAATASGVSTSPAAFTVPVASAPMPSGSLSSIGVATPIGQTVLTRTPRAP